MAASMADRVVGDEKQNACIGFLRWPQNSVVLIDDVYDWLIA